MFGKNKETTTKKLVLSPTEYMAIDDSGNFESFCLNRLLKNNTEVKSGKTIFITMLGHDIPFYVKSCTPENSIIDKKTEIEITKFTRSDMTLEEAGLSLFTDSGVVKQLIFKLIKHHWITEENGLAIWKEFRKRQKENKIDSNDKKGAEITVSCSRCGTHSKYILDKNDIESVEKGNKFEIICTERKCQKKIDATEKIKEIIKDLDIFKD